MGASQNSKVKKKLHFATEIPKTVFSVDVTLHNLAFKFECV